MPTLPCIDKMLNNTSTLPSIGPFLIDWGSGCELCGDSFEASEVPQSILPCVDSQCESCARMWRTLSSPICPACYGNYTCPKVARDQARTPSPRMDLQANDRIQQQSLPVLQTESIDSDSDIISEPRSPMREEADEITAVSEPSDEYLREALVLANNSAGTNFTIQEIELEIPLDDIYNNTTAQLTETLTQFCMWKASRGGEDDSADESFQQLDGDDPVETTPREDGGIADDSADESLQQLDGDESIETTPQEDGETAQETKFRCLYCKEAFGKAGDLRQHMSVHTVKRLSCTSLYV